jgi:hypothetical protein
MRMFVNLRLIAVIVTAMLCPMWSNAQESKEAAFWKWFVLNQDELLHFEKDQERIFDRLSKALSQVHESLTFEFGPIQADETREFVISTAGIKAGFASVESLFSSAPKLPKWKVLKFRQRRSPLNDLEFAGHKVKSADVHYAIFKDQDPAKLGVMLFFDGYREEEKSSVWGQIGYLFLDEALGEYDVEILSAISSALRITSSL